SRTCARRPNWKPWATAGGWCRSCCRACPTARSTTAPRSASPPSAASPAPWSGAPAATGLLRAACASPSHPTEPPPMSPAANSAVRDRLRIAIQKTGRLSEPARALLASSGLSWRESRDRLFCYGESLPVDLLLVRDDDIPGLIADGVCDLGIVGRNVLAEQAGERVEAGKPELFREWRALGFGGCRLSLAVP